MRLIDGDALYEQTAEWANRSLNAVVKTMNDEDKTEWQKWSTINAERSAFLIDIMDSPTVDAVPVVRCKECRYSREPNRYDRDEKAACEGVLICCVGYDHVYPSAYDGLIFIDESDYCSKGERREEEHDER